MEQPSNCGQTRVRTAVNGPNNRSGVCYKATPLEGVSLQVLELHRTFRGSSVFTHRALVWFLPSVPPHVNHQHVLGLEGLLLPGTLLPAAHELLLLPVDVVVIDVLWDTRMSRSFFFPYSAKRLSCCPRADFLCRNPSYLGFSKGSGVPASLIRTLRILRAAWMEE